MFSIASPDSKKMLDDWKQQINLEADILPANDAKAEA